MMKILKYSSQKVKFFSLNKVNNLRIHKKVEGVIEIGSGVAKLLNIDGVQYLEVIKNIYKQQAGQREDSYEKNNFFFKKKAQENVYDVEIDSKSFLNLVQGWEVRMSKKFMENQSLQQKMVTVLGPFNSGKTFLANKIAGFNLEQGKDTETLPLSLKFSEQKGQELSVLDTGGKGRAIRIEEIFNTLKLQSSKESDWRKKKNLWLKTIKRDRAFLEDFVERFAIHYCDVIVLIVGHLKESEQTFINRIIEMVNDNESNQKKEIIIAHNLMNVDDSDEIKRRIINDIELCFKVQSQVFNDKLIQDLKSPKAKQLIKELDVKYYQQQPGSGPSIVHLVFTKFSANPSNPSDIELAYNQIALQYIRTQIIAKQISYEKNDFIAFLINYLSKNLPRYLLNSLDQDYFRQKKSYDNNTKLSPKFEIQQEDSKQADEKYIYKKIILKDLTGQDKFLNHLNLQPIQYDDFGSINQYKSKHKYEILKQNQQIIIIINAQGNPDENSIQFTSQSVPTTTKYEIEIEWKNVLPKTIDQIHQTKNEIIHLGDKQFDGPDQKFNLTIDASDYQQGKQQIDFQKDPEISIQEGFIILEYTFYEQGSKRQLKPKKNN